MKVHERELQADDIDAAKRRFEALRAKEFPAFLAEDLTETDTRSKIIDCRISSDRTHPISWDGYHLIS
jgi:hypothetical protein